MEEKNPRHESDIVLKEVKGYDGGKDRNMCLVREECYVASIRVKEREKRNGRREGHKKKYSMEGRGDKLFTATE